MKQLIFILFLSAVLASCGTAIEVRMVKLDANGTVVPATFNRRISKRLEVGNRVSLRQTGEFRWSHAYSYYRGDSSIVNKYRKRGFRIQYVLGTVAD